MTATAAHLSTEKRVVATIKALRASRGMSVDEIIARTGIKRSTWFGRMRTGEFTIGEIVAVADVFGVSVQELVDGKVTVARLRRDQPDRPFRVLSGGGRSSVIQPGLTQSVPCRPIRHSGHASV